MYLHTLHILNVQLRGIKSAGTDFCLYELNPDVRMYRGPVLPNCTHKPSENISNIKTGLWTQKIISQRLTAACVTVNIHTIYYILQVTSIENNWSSYNITVFRVTALSAEYMQTFDSRQRVSEEVGAP